MTDSDLTHDLLALAGHDDNDKKDASDLEGSDDLSEDNNEDFDSDGDAESEEASDIDTGSKISDKKLKKASEERHVAKKKHSSSLQKARQSSKNSSRQGESSRKSFDIDFETQTEESIASLYPLEGKYKNEEDRSKLLAMSEIERESILYEREEEVAKLQEKLRLAQRLQEQQEREQLQQDVQSKRHKTRTGISATESARSSHLSELKALREAKINKKRQSELKRKRVYDSDSEYGEDDEEPKQEGADSEILYDSEEEERESRKLERKIDYKDADSVRIGRKHCAKYMFHPLFENTVVGCFVLIKIGENSQSGHSVYRLCTVRNVVKLPKIYNVDGVNSNLGLECLHGASSKVFEMSVISNESVDQALFDRWITAMNDDKMSIPSITRIQRKLQELIEMTKHVLTDEEISEMIKAKKSVNRIPTNVAFEKTRLRQQINAANMNGDINLVSDLENQLATLVELTTDRNQSQKHLELLAKVNERNRRANNKEIRSAEIRMQQEQRKKQTLSQGITSDPFSRLKTAPRLFVDNQPTEFNVTGGGNEELKSTDEPPRSIDGSHTQPSSDDKAAQVNSESIGTAASTGDVSNKNFLDANVLPTTHRKQNLDDIIANNDLGIDIEI